MISKLQKHRFGDSCTLCPHPYPRRSNAGNRHALSLQFWAIHYVHFIAVGRNRGRVRAIALHERVITNRCQKADIGSALPIPSSSSLALTSDHCVPQ